MKHILVGIDGSIESLDAVSWAADLAKQLGADVIAASVFGFYPVVAIADNGVYMSEDGLNGWRKDLQRDLDGDWTKALRDAGVAVTTRVEEGQAAEVLLRLAAEYAVDLIVVGSRGHGMVKAMFLGSVSHILALRAPCPVVILPHPHQRHGHEPKAPTSAIVPSTSTTGH